MTIRLVLFDNTNTMHVWHLDQDPDMFEILICEANISHTTKDKILQALNEYDERQMKEFR